MGKNSGRRDEWVSICVLAVGVIASCGGVGAAPGTGDRAGGVVAEVVSTGRVAGGTKDC